MMPEAPQNGAQHKAGFRPGRVTILLPAKNEEAAIGLTLRSIPRQTLKAAGFEVETIILDGKSRDATRDLAYEHGDTTVVFEEGQGKGQALKYVRRLIKSDYVIMMDGDGTYAADAIPRMLGPLAWGQADVVMGRRNVRPGAMSGLHKVGNRFLSFVARVLYQRPCPDLCTGMWGFRGAALQAMPLRSRRFDLEAEMFALANRLGHRIEHVNMDYLPRKGASKLSTRDGFSILWRLVQRRFTPLGQVTPGPAPVGRGTQAHGTR